MNEKDELHRCMRFDLQGKIEKVEDIVSIVRFRYERRYIVLNIS